MNKIEIIRGQAINIGVKDIYDLMSKYGTITVLIIGLIITIIWLSIKSSWFRGKVYTLYKYFFKKGDKKSEIKISNIINHDIFNYIDFWTFSKIPTFNFSTSYRTAVFRKYLTIFLKKQKEDLVKYVESRKFEEMDDSELWKSLLDLINTQIYNYEKEMESSGIPKAVIEKMKSKNNETISLTIDLIAGICNSQFYKSDKNLLKMYSILNIMLSVLENAISNSEDVCNSINGALKGLSFTEGGKTYKEP